MSLYGETVWYKSTTLWGVAASMIGKLVAVLFQIDVSDQDAATLGSALSLAASGVGDIVAWVGRLRATKQIAPKA